jgi:alkaline phosphatase D
MLQVAALFVAQIPVAAQENSVSSSEPLSRIVFGSCIQQDRPTPIFHTLLAERSELLLFTGDNVYGDTNDMAELRAKYQRLDSNANFAKLRQHCPMLATWDDHDYGINDGGADYAHKTESQKAFVDFWRLDSQSPVRQRDGVYDAHLFGPSGKRTQVILLDTRYFRSPLKTGPRRVAGPYVPDDDASKTMLGDEQWEWLERQLQQPAQLRLIVSSIQFVSSAAGQECWANLPQQREKMLELIRSTQATGVVFISGDRHWSEISADSDSVGYPIYDITCSSLNQIHARATPTENFYRVSKSTFHYENYGVLSIDWEAADPVAEFSIRDIEGTPRIQQSIPLKKLHYSSTKSD